MTGLLNLNSQTKIKKRIACELTPGGGTSCSLLISPRFENESELVSSFNQSAVDRPYERHFLRNEEFERLRSGSGILSVAVYL